MGLVASQARLIMLTARRQDLEFQAQMINQARMQLSNIVGQLFSINANLDPDSTTAQQLQGRLAALQQIDKALEMQLQRLDKQRDAINTEFESLNKIIEKNIETSFNALS